MMTTEVHENRDVYLDTNLRPCASPSPSECCWECPMRDGDSDLLKAMIQIAETNKGPENQIPSAGCGIKWKTN